jgi:FtsZ-interacting cell division protein ZipA
MKLGEGEVLAIILGIAAIVVISVVGLDYWSINQTKVMFNKAYLKHMECRIASQNSGFTNSIERICGEIPRFKDFK